MKKNFITGVVVGGLVFGAVGVFAGQYVATDNYFPIELNGEKIPLIGYNVEGSTYFKLRDIADKVGGFTVDFQNNTIKLTTTGNSTVSHNHEVNNSTQNNYTSNPAYIAALEELTSNYKSECKAIDEVYERFIEANDITRDSYENKINDIKDEISELEKKADIYSNAATDSGQSEYKRILSKIDSAEEDIDYYESMIARLDALDATADQKRIQQKNAAEQTYNEMVLELNSMYQY